MRVSVVDPSAYTPPYDHALCSALARAGVEVELVTSRFLYGPAPEPSDYRIREHFYRLSSRRYEDRPMARGRLVMKMAEHPVDMVRFLRLVSSESPEMVHFQWAPVQPLDSYFLRRIKRPVVITAHDVVPREPLPGQLRSLRRLYDSADAVVVHTRHGSERLHAEVGIETEKIHVIPHGALDYLAGQPEEQPMDPAVGDLDGRQVVLFFGLMRPYKGIDVLVEAFKQTPPNAVLLIVGMARMDVEPLVERAREMGLGERVRFLPRFVGDREIPAYFRRADLVVLPYREIDQSGVLYTALAFQKPMVLSSVGGFTEFAEDHGAARLVPPGDAEALGNAISELLQDREEREGLAQEAARAADGPFAWDRIAAKTLELYGELFDRCADDGRLR